MPNKLIGDGFLLEPVADADAIVTGLDRYLRCLPAAGKAHCIRVEADGTFNSADLRRAAESLVMIRGD